MSYEVHLVIETLIKFFFKGQDHKHPVDDLFDLVDAGLFPGPYLWRDIVKNTDVLLLCEFSDPKIKAWIIHQDQYVGTMFQKVLFTEINVPENCPDVHQHFGESHEREITVVFYQISALRLHQVAAPAAELR